MNNFYASVECMLDPTLKKYPVAVCGSVEERHGIVLAKNYAAKAFGVATGDAVWQAKQKCKDLVIVPPHYEEYIKYSKLARSVYSRFTDQVEPYGMDECWLDISGTESLICEARLGYEETGCSNRNTQDDKVYLESGRNHPNGSNISSTRTLDKENLSAVFEKYKSGSKPSNVTEITFNSVYWFGIFRDLKI